MLIGNLKIYGVIYIITNSINGQVYIGQTTKKRGFDGRYYHKGQDAEKVYKYHKYYKEKYNNRYNDRLLNSLEKYGWENFKVNKMLDFAFSKEELNIKEKVWIEYYKSYDRKYGFNNEFGGNNSPISDKTKNKMRDSSLPKNIDYILQIDKYNNIVNKFISYQVASDFTGIGRAQITNNVIGAKKTCHGYVFIRESNFNNEFLNPLQKAKNIKPKKEKIDRRKKIVLLNTLEVFNMIKEAGLKYNIDSSGIAKNCKGLYNCYGQLKNGEKAVWVYYDKYKTLRDDDIQQMLSRSKEKKVICLTTEIVFNSIKEAGEYYKCGSSKIVEVCKGRRKTCGKLGDGTPLVWMYYKDYIKK